MRTSGAVSFTVFHVHWKGKQIDVPHAFVLPKATMDKPASPVGSIEKWKHLNGLDLADPEFGTPACIDVLLEANPFEEILLCCQPWSPRGTPYALRTWFEWVLVGSFQPKSPQPAAYTCCIPTEDNSLRKFSENEDNNVKQHVLSPEERTVFHHWESLHSKDN